MVGLPPLVIPFSEENHLRKSSYFLTDSEFLNIIIHIYLACLFECLFVCLFVLVSNERQND